MKKIFILTKIVVSIFLFFSVESAMAVPSFRIEEGVRIPHGNGSFVLPLDNGSYRIFFSTAFGILSAVSTDGLNWTTESGFRVEPSTFSNYDNYKAVNPTIMKFTTYYRMIYEGITLSPTTNHFFLSAVSTDTFHWAKEMLGEKSKILLRILSKETTVFIFAPEAISLGTSTWRLYYTVNSASYPYSTDKDAVGSAITTDAGEFWQVESGFRVSARAVNSTVCKLTDGKFRLFWLGSSSLNTEPSNNAIYSALSSDGINFAEKEQVLISDGEISDPHIVRYSNYGWRLYYSSKTKTENDFKIYSVVADTPSVNYTLPRSGYNTEIASTLISGEIFDSSPTVKLIQSGSEIVGTNLIRNSDLSISCNFDLRNKNLGSWDIEVTNSNGRKGILKSGFEIKITPGRAWLVDNLFNPLNNGKVKIKFQIFVQGKVTIKVYTLDGRFIKTLYEGELSAGTYDFLDWNGYNESGEIVGSGVYFIHIDGPGLKVNKKTIIVK